MNRMSVGAVAVLAVVLTACGGGQERAYADAIAASAQQGDTPFSPTADEAQCIGDAYVEVLGVARFEEAGVTPEDIRNETDPVQNPRELGIGEAEAGELFDQVNECTDVRELVLQGLSRDSQLSPEARTCLSDAIDDDLLRRLFVARVTRGGEGLQGNEQLSRELITAISACVDVLPPGE